jgi:hypothetical protein
LRSDFSSALISGFFSVAVARVVAIIALSGQHSAICLNRAPPALRKSRELKTDG